MDLVQTKAKRVPVVPVPPVTRKRVKTAPPVLDAPTGLRCPRKVLGERRGLVRSYCGPWVIMAITGRPYDEVKASLNMGRSRTVTQAVKGTYDSEVRSVLTAYGFHSTWLPIKGDSFAATLRARTSEQMQEVWLVSAGKHWMLVKGRKATCAMLQCWSWIKHAKKRRAPVRAIYKITKREDSTALTKRKATIETVGKALKQAGKTKVAKRRTYSALTLAKREAMVEVNRLAGLTAIYEKDMERITLDAPEGWRFSHAGESDYYTEPGDGSGWKEVTALLKGRSFSEMFEQDEE